MRQSANPIRVEILRETRADLREIGDDNGKPESVTIGDVIQVHPDVAKDLVDSRAARVTKLPLRRAVLKPSKHEAPVVKV